MIRVVRDVTQRGFIFVYLTYQCTLDHSSSALGISVLSMLWIRPEMDIRTSANYIVCVVNLFGNTISQYCYTYVYFIVCSKDLQLFISYISKSDSSRVLTISY